MTEVECKRGFFSFKKKKKKGKYNLRVKKERKQACRLYRQGVHFHVSVLCEVTQFSFVEKHAKGQKEVSSKLSGKPKGRLSNRLQERCAARVQLYQMLIADRSSTYSGIHTR